jgi:transposase
MAHVQARDPRKVQEWTRWIQLWQQSKLSIRAFCLKHRLSESSFFAWRRQLKLRDVAPVAFVPIRVVPDAAAANSANPIDLVLADGRCLRVPPGFDPATLRQLLAVLEDNASC